MNPSPTATGAAPPDLSLTRRRFLRSAAAGSALTFTSHGAFAQGGTTEVGIALVGCGTQGNVLLNAVRPLLKEMGLRLLAVCDIWDFNRENTANRYEKLLNYKINRYAEIDELLAKEANLTAVLVASPDFLHHVHSIAALKAGKQVYCEKMMSNSVEFAREMVLAQKETGKLLQIGHQRRSNPRYLHLRDKVINEHKLLGQITHCQAQWNRSVTKPIGWAKGKELPADLLARFGYDSMEHFTNWRWYKKYGGGAISDLGAHQIDLFNWFFKTTPTSIVASGGRDYYDGSNGRGNFEHNDNVIITYEYQVEGKPVRCMYTVLTTTGSQGVFEKFMGDQASAIISEDLKNNQLYKENRGDDSTWTGDDMVAKGVLKPRGDAVHHKFWEKPKPWWSEDKWLYKEGVVDVRVSKAPESYELPVILNDLPHTPHLRNFFTVLKANGRQDELNCPVQQAYETCVTVLKANQAIIEGRKLMFDPAEFTV